MGATVGVSRRRTGLRPKSKASSRIREVKTKRSLLLARSRTWATTDRRTASRIRRTRTGSGRRARTCPRRRPSRQKYSPACSRMPPKRPQEAVAETVHIHQALGAVVAAAAAEAAEAEAEGTHIQAAAEVEAVATSPPEAAAAEADLPATEATTRSPATDTEPHHRTDVHFAIRSFVNLGTTSSSNL